MPPAREAPPALARGEAHVWLADLDGSRDSAAAPLSEDERARAATIISPRRRLRWAAARSILRELLATYLGEDARRLALAAGPGGKPELAGEATRLRFSVSHSSGTALYALASDLELGVDVERLGRPRLRAQDERELLRAWVRREARGKCLGVGLAPAPGGQDPPWVRELTVGAGAVAALACTAPVRVRALRWPA